MIEEILIFNFFKINFFKKNLNIINKISFNYFSLKNTKFESEVGTEFLYLFVF